MNCISCNSTEAEAYPCYGNLCRRCWQGVVGNWGVVLECAECGVIHCPFIGRYEDDILDERDEDELGW